MFEYAFIVFLLVFSFNAQIENCILLIIERRSKWSTFLSGARFFIFVHLHLMHFDLYDFEWLLSFRHSSTELQSWST